MLMIITEKREKGTTEEEVNVDDNHGEEGRGNDRRRSKC